MQRPEMPAISINVGNFNRQNIRITVDAHSKLRDVLADIKAKYNFSWKHVIHNGKIQEGSTFQSSLTSLDIRDGDTIFLVSNRTGG